MINWISVKEQPPHRTHVQGLFVASDGVWHLKLYHEVINGKSIYYDEDGFQVSPKAWKPYKGE